RNVIPFEQSAPRLIGLSGSPSTCTTVGVTFRALSPRVWMITPHATAQYGQMLCVSVVREIFSSRACASAGRTSKPKAVVTAPLVKAPLIKLLRDRSIACPALLPFEENISLSGVKI